MPTFIISVLVAVLVASDSRGFGSSLQSVMR
jgi:hypothetical protein